MKKLLIICLLVVILVPSLALAYTVNDASSFLKAANKGAGVEETDVSTMLARAVKTALVTVGIIFFIVIFYGGFLWMTAHGNEEQVKKAQNAIIGACIGIMIVIASYAITNFVMTKVVRGEGGSSAGSYPAALGDSPLGCCLTALQISDDAWNLNKKYWSWEISTYASCQEKGELCDVDDVACGTDDWRFIADKSAKECEIEKKYEEEGVKI